MSHDNRFIWEEYKNDTYVNALCCVETLASTQEAEYFFSEDQ
jgi:hypothetical protein